MSDVSERLVMMIASATSCRAQVRRIITVLRTFWSFQPNVINKLLTFDMSATFCKPGPLLLRVKVKCSMTFFVSSMGSRRGERGRHIFALWFGDFRSFFSCKILMRITRFDNEAVGTHRLHLHKFVS